MRPMFLWTINDWSARSSLSGWSGQGYIPCATCNEDTPLYHEKIKVVYIGHCRFLDGNDPLRKRLDFNGLEKARPTLRHFSNDDIQEQLDYLLTRKPGKHPKHGGRDPKRQDDELNGSKRRYFFELEDWSSLQLKHNINFMHVEKNMDESLLGTLLMNDKSKDTSNAREDLKILNIRRNEWFQRKGDKFHRPHARYSFTKSSRQLFCQFIKNVKLPDGFGSNISKKVNDTNTNIVGFKAHNHHILMQHLIPIGVRRLLDKDTYTPIFRPFYVFQATLLQNIEGGGYEKRKSRHYCNLVQVRIDLSSSFFDIVVHLLLHLSDEAIIGGLVCMRWMYTFERYTKKLKNYVRSKARLEGSIAEGYVAEEALSFCSMYLRDVQTQFNRPERNEDVIVEKQSFGCLCLNVDRPAQLK